MAKCIDYVILAKKIFDLCIIDNKTSKEAHSLLKEEGYEISERTINTYKEDVFKLLQQRNGQVEIRKYALDSIDKIKEDFDLARDEIRKIITTSSDKRDKMNAIRVLKDLIDLAIRRLEGFKENVLTVNTNNFYSVQQVGEIVNKGRIDWMKHMDAEFDEKQHVLIFKKPTPEIIEAYRKWKSIEV